MRISPIRQNIFNRNLPFARKIKRDKHGKEYPVAIKGQDVYESCGYYPKKLRVDSDYSIRMEELKKYSKPVGSFSFYDYSAIINHLMSKGEFLVNCEYIILDRNPSRSSCGRVGLAEAGTNSYDKVKDRYEYSYDEFVKLIRKIERFNSRRYPKKAEEYAQLTQKLIDKLDAQIQENE